jgi:hypothetical protein
MQIRSLVFSFSRLSPRFFCSGGFSRQGGFAVYGYIGFDVRELG